MFLIYFLFIFFMYLFYRYTCVYILKSFFFFFFFRYFKRWCSIDREAFPAKNLYVSPREFQNSGHRFALKFNYAYITVIYFCNFDIRIKANE